MTQVQDGLTEEMMDILILMPDRHLGNLVVSTHAMRAIRESYREARIHLLVDTAYMEVVETLGFDTLIPYPREGLKRGNILMRLRRYMRLIHSLRVINPDIAVDLEGREYSSVLTYLSGADVRFGPATSKRAFLYNRKVNPGDYRHKVFKYISIASAMGAGMVTGFNLRPSDDKRRTLHQKLRDYGVSLDKPIICIHSSAGKLYKKWGHEGFAVISDWLSSRGLQVVFVGSANDIDDVKKIGSITRYPFYNTAGRLSIGELMSLFELSLLFLGNDSGPMHLASAIGLPVVALFGPADETRWGPLSARSAVLRGDEPCEECMGKDCEYGFRCIRGLSADDVKDAISTLLDMEKRIEA